MRASRLLLPFVSLLLAPAVPAAAQDACLSVTPPQVTLRLAEGCRIQAAVLNACGRAVRFAIVRAVPHPVRGPLPTETRTVERFALAPLTFERELCEQNVRLMEFAGSGGLRDVTEVRMTPALAFPDMERRQGEVAACVARCPVPANDRAQIVTELRQRYRHAVDDADGQGPLAAMVDLILRERAEREQVCAAVCHGAVAPQDAQARIGALEAATMTAMTVPGAALAAIAARPPRIAAVPPPPPVPAADDGERRTETRGAVQRRVGRAIQANRCRMTARGQRCTFILTPGRSGEAREARQQRREGRRERRGRR